MKIIKINNKILLILIILPYFLIIWLFLWLTNRDTLLSDKYYSLKKENSILNSKIIELEKKINNL